RLLPQDRRIDLLKRGTRLDAELIDERTPRRVVALQRVRLPTCAVEREHQLAAHPLAKGVLVDERLELADEIAGAAELEVGVNASLDGVQPQFLEAADLVLRERLEGEIGKRRPSPERKRFAQNLRSPGRVGPPRLRTQQLEAREVELLRLD